MSEHGPYGDHMTYATPALPDLLTELDAEVASVIATVPTVSEGGGDFSAEDIPSPSSGAWVKLNEVVAVVFDLKSSTLLGTGKHDTSTARIYQAAVEGAVKTMHEFGANFIDIQGDGGFGLFWGERRYERALCSAVTVRTFSELLVARLEKKWESLQDLATGYKVGIHAHRTLVKSLGTRRNVAEQEAVWAGKPVNFAAKCAQAASRHEVVVTQDVWEKYKRNDYIAFSCSCHDGPSANLWKDKVVQTLPDDEQDAVVLEAGWCETCGPEYCAAIMAGKTKRDIPESVRQAVNKMKILEALTKKAEREAVRRRTRGGVW